MDVSISHNLQQLVTMIGDRTFLMLVFGCWIISIPVMFFNLEEYHPIHDQKQELIDGDHIPKEDMEGVHISSKDMAVHHNAKRELRDGDYISELNILHEDQIPRQDILNSDQNSMNQVWPLLNEGNDRILDQLQLRTTHGSALKSILLHSSFANENLPLGQEKFIIDECPVTACSLTKKSDDARTADLIITKGSIDNFLKEYPERPKNQINVWYQLESPMNHQLPHGKVNWTATYRRDSTITAPYEKFAPVSDYHILQRSPTNYAKDKTKKVAWFVSNCHAGNGRLEYAKELANYIEVDIYGSCGPFKCSRSNQTKCEELLNRDYKFYLSFENSHCKDYVTEKFYITGLG